MRNRPTPVLLEERYQSIFEHAAVSLWEMDISGLRARLARMKSTAGFTLSSHLAAHPDAARDLALSIEVSDLNHACLRLFEADSKEQLLGPADLLERAISPEALREAITAIDEGRSEIEVETEARTLKGRLLSVIIRAHIPAADAAYNRMLVNIVDLTDRREAEERERQGAHLLRSIIDSSPDSIFVKDAALRMVLCNAALARAIGKAPAEMYGKTDVENGWSPDLVKGNREKGIEGWEKDDLAVLAGSTVHAGAEPTDFEGAIRWFDTVKFPLRDPDGSITGLVGIGRDVTERRRVEAELTRERALFTILMENVPDFIYFKDRESRFLRVSRSLAMEQGLQEPVEALGKTDRDFLPPEIARDKREDELRIMRTGGPLVAIEEKLRYTSGPDMWQLTTKLPLRDAQGAIIGTFGISHDITRRKEMEARDQQLAALVESSDDAIVGMDLQRGITVWNKGAERVYGYTAHEMVGKRTSILIPPELEEEARGMREKALRGEQLMHYETTRVRNDGARILISLTLSAVRDQAGRITGLASVARDVTEQKALQSRLDRAQRLEGLATMAGGVAHQFNNINTVVLGYLDMMISDTGLDERLRNYGERARAAVQRSVDITSRLLAMTDPGSPAVSVSLESLARRAAAVVGPRMMKEGVEADLRLADTPLVEVDETRLLFVLSSLLDNALDSLVDRPVRRVTLRTGSGPDGVFVEVEDTGCGIPGKDLPRVFTPFYTAKGEWAPPGSPQARVRGVGLSLAVSQAMMNGYGGRIEVQSTPGTGSTFRVVLPLAGG